MGTPGNIQVTPDAVYAYWAARGVDLDAVIVDHIAEWAESVPSGTTVSIHDMMNYTGDGHGMALEIVMAHVFPPDGSPCVVAGVVGVVAEGPLAPQALGRPHLIHKL